MRYRKSFLVLFFWFLVPAAFAGQTSSDTRYERLSTRIRQRFEELRREAGYPGGTVGFVLPDGHSLKWTESYFEEFDKVVSDYNIGLVSNKDGTCHTSHETTRVLLEQSRQPVHLCWCLGKQLSALGGGKLPLAVNEKPRPLFWILLTI